ncbi:MAG: hypothetical protein ACJ72U_08375 [Nitrososphaeraceae archaeon]
MTTMNAYPKLLEGFFRVTWQQFLKFIVVVKTSSTAIIVTLLFNKSKPPYLFCLVLEYLQQLKLQLFGLF